MENNNKPNLDDWNDFSGEWLKPNNVKTFPVTLVCTNVDGEISKEGRARMWIETELPAGRAWKLNLNKTNQAFVQIKGLLPKQLIGKKLIFDKCKVRDPKKDAIVDSFMLIDIK
jgi:hypothetical protein